MLVGFVERRLTGRIPFKVELAIHFERNGQKTALATGTDISAGGIRFFVPWGTEVAQPGETAEFVFDLPNLGEIRILGEIRHLRFGIDLDQNRIVYYGARFINLSVETWNHLVDFCQASDDLAGNEQKTVYQPLKIEKERQDFRVPTGDLPIAIMTPDGAKTDAHLEDISFGGVKVRFSGATPLYKEVKIVIQDGEYNGICLWAVPLNPPDIGFRGGYRFIDLSKEQFEKLRSFIFTLASQ